MKIDPEGLQAPYLQLADALRARIKSGEFQPGRKVPSQTELEDMTGLSRNTVKKALDVLKVEGLLITAPGRGLFVAERPKT
ncbi:GntR family transcriptional regulator [Nonomuraea mesophila]|uniref:GntR family transcriptional regulator n=1 Tax=Nonomuraea mesophila TaxID=2530382 RepID=A0A4R5FZ82_9ACTN|nr:GntR family transcriptional regulator [Nonomuraea mesophila]TDE60378.1 GntR family transcriptional regulator [Nonomuraea mesophila]